MKVNQVIMSLLSDAQELISFGQAYQATKTINFAKTLLLKYPCTNEEITNEELATEKRKFYDN